MRNTIKRHKLVLDYAPITPKYRLMEWGEHRPDTMVLVARITSQNGELIRFQMDENLDMGQGTIEAYRALVVKMLAELPVEAEALNDLDKTFASPGQDVCLTRNDGPPFKTNGRDPVLLYMDQLNVRLENEAILNEQSPPERAGFETI